MVIDEKLLDELSAQAKASPRLRMNYNFHQSLDEKCHRFLNAVEPGADIPIHHHPTKEESFILLRGRVRVTTYNDDGTVMESVVLDANGDVRCINVEKARWHSLECLESGSVLLESKDGKYEPLREEEIMSL